MTFQPTEMYNDIAELQIADGLKELLIEYGFTRKKIVRVQATQLAAILGIEDYIGKIIYNAAKLKSGKV
jgi:hypothetical protein